MLGSDVPMLSTSIYGVCAMKNEYINIKDIAKAIVITIPTLAIARICPVTYPQTFSDIESIIIPVLSRIAIGKSLNVVFLINCLSAKI